MAIFSKQDLEFAYKSGLSMVEIAKVQKVSLNTIAYWMKKYEIKSRSRSEATYLKRHKGGADFLIDNSFPELLSIGVALYLGEGTKKGHGVRFTNSDPGIIRLFLCFLYRVCGVRKEKVRAWINYFDDSGYDEVLDFWVKETGIGAKNFYKPVIRPRKLGTYKKRSVYGTITILFTDKKLKDQIEKWSLEMTSKYADMAQW